MLAETTIARAEATKYLSDTDWYVTRLVEREIAIPDDVKIARTDAIAILDKEI